MLYANTVLIEIFMIQNIDSDPITKDLASKPDKIQTIIVQNFHKMASDIRARVCSEIRQSSFYQSFTYVLLCDFIQKGFMCMEFPI